MWQKLFLGLVGMRDYFTEVLSPYIGLCCNTDPCLSHSGRGWNIFDLNTVTC